jgi:hypothetical protein
LAARDRQQHRRRDQHDFSHTGVTGPRPNGYEVARVVVAKNAEREAFGASVIRAWDRQPVAEFELDFSALSSEPSVPDERRAGPNVRLTRAPTLLQTGAVRKGPYRRGGSRVT